MIAGSEVLTSLLVKVPFFWAGTPCRLEIHLPTIRRSLVTYQRGQAVRPERTRVDCFRKIRFDNELYKLCTEPCVMLLN